MLARREMILARIEEVLGTVGGVETVARNRGMLDNDARPALVLLDGDESGGASGGRPGGPRMTAALVTMRPQVFVVLKSAKPQNAGVGPALNELRGAVLAALVGDQDLITLVGTSGKIRYDGCETDLKSGMQLDGQMRLDFAITTIVDPNI